MIFLVKCFGFKGCTTLRQAQGRRPEPPLTIKYFLIYDLWVNFRVVFINYLNSGILALK